MNWKRVQSRWVLKLSVEGIEFKVNMGEMKERLGHRVPSLRATAATVGINSYHKENKPFGSTGVLMDVITSYLWVGLSKHYQSKATVQKPYVTHGLNSEEGAGIIVMCIHLRFLNHA